MIVGISAVAFTLATTPFCFHKRHFGSPEAF
jgi:hypothetical protein